MLKKKENVSYADVDFVEWDGLEDEQFVALNIQTKKIHSSLANGQQDGIKREALHHRAVDVGQLPSSVLN